MSDPYRSFRERAEFLALKVIVTRLLLVAFQNDPKLVKPFTEGIDRTFDTFEFFPPKGGGAWTDDDVTRGREHMRAAGDWVLSPAVRGLRQRAPG
jgi:hypothetical protein